jgi:hypothetical protein
LERRDFVTSAIAMAGAALSGGEARGQVPSTQEYYLLRKYSLRNGAQLTLTQNYFAQALIPALNNMSIKPVGAFKLDIGPDTPAYYLLIPSLSVETLVTLDKRLAENKEFSSAAAAFWSAPATATAFERVETSLFSAFSGWPKLTVPKSQKRIFQLRTYESPSEAAHVRKVQMFNEAEIAIFVRTGLAPVFFGDTLVGHHMPSLTYMLTFEDVADLNKKWPVFGGDPEWKDLSHRPGNTDPEIVSNISNLYLSPLACSQI